MFSEKELQIMYNLPFDTKFFDSKAGQRAYNEASNTAINELRGFTPQQAALLNRIYEDNKDGLDALKYL